MVSPAAACKSPDEQPATTAAPSGLDVVETTVTTADGTVHSFNTEVARTRSQQNRGLMYRDSLGPNDGMIFIYSPPQEVSFWMKNTYIPLDIIYVRADGTIARIIENAVPLDLTPQPSLEPIELVLEIPGGRAAELGIEAGDMVEWPR